MTAGLKKIIRRMARPLVRLTDGLREPNFIGSEHIHGLDSIHGICRSATLIARPGNDGKGSITFGEKVWLGEDVEIEINHDQTIVIGADTSLQNGCVIRGDVTIGAHCTFARNVMAMSTQHHFRDMPAWLIRDQDRAYTAAHSKSDPAAGIFIEEDCWFGAGSAVMPGTYIGRGAIIGANTVVTRDIAPYEVHGGTPNRRLSIRLPFAPPAKIDAKNDDNLPYFYRGFRLTQAELAQSRKIGVIGASQSIRLVLKGGGDTVTIYGKCQPQIGTMRIAVNGQECAEKPNAAKEFSWTVPVSKVINGQIPAALREYTVVDILSDASVQDFGIAEAHIC